ELEVLLHVLLEHRRRKRTEPLTEFRLEVHLLLHLGISCVADDAAVAERPRAELHPALEPADDLALGQPGGDHATQFAEVGVVLRDALVFADRALDLARR